MSVFSGAFGLPEVLRLVGRTLNRLPAWQPTSSYLWRTVMPHLKGMGRLILCDPFDMGDSGKLANSRPNRYTFMEQREHLSRLWEKLWIDGDVIFVLRDWGSAPGFNWAYRHQDLVSGIAYMESLVIPQVWDDWGVEVVREDPPGLPGCGR